MKKHSLQQVVDHFLMDLKAAGYAPRTLEEHRTNLGHLVEYLEEQGIDDIQAVTPEDLAAYQKAAFLGQLRSKRALALNTLVVRVCLVRTFFGHLVKKGVLIVNPARRLDPPRVPRRLPRNILSLSEVRRLLLAPDVRTPWGLRDRAMLEVLYSSGIRASELIGLDVYDIELTAGELTVRRGKGGHARRVPVGRAACLWVNRYLTEGRPKLARRESEKAMFLNWRGVRMHRCRLAVMVGAHGKKAGTSTRVTPHRLRHAFATHMLRNRAPLRHLQEMLGHARLATTQIYTRVDITDLKAVHRRCHPRGRE